MARDTSRADSTGEVTALRREARELIEVDTEQTLDKLDVPRTTLYRWYDHYQIGGSEASVYRVLKSLDLITCPTFIVIKAADEFRDKTTTINQLSQIDLQFDNDKWQFGIVFEAFAKADG